MPRRSAAVIQARMVERNIREGNSTGSTCQLCGHLMGQHQRMRNSSFCEECHKICGAR